MRVRVCVSRRVRAAEPEVPRPQRMARAGRRGQYCLTDRATLILLHVKNGMLFGVFMGRVRIRERGAPTPAGRAARGRGGGGRGGGRAPGGGGPARAARPYRKIEPCGAWETSAKTINGY